MSGCNDTYVALGGGPPESTAADMICFVLLQNLSCSGIERIGGQRVPSISRLASA